MIRGHGIGILNIQVLKGVLEVLDGSSPNPLYIPSSASLAASFAAAAASHNPTSHLPPSIHPARTLADSSDKDFLSTSSLPSQFSEFIEKCVRSMLGYCFRKVSIRAIRSLYRVRPSATSFGHSFSVATSTSDDLYRYSGAYLYLL